MTKFEHIPVVDLFAGPGGLGEGFSALGREKGLNLFKICLSIEENYAAHQTLELRSFFRQFPGETVPEEYYRYIRGEMSRSDLFGTYPREAETASLEAWRATIGKVSPDEVDNRIEKSIGGRKTWVLIGGPPCQPYSLVGRARRGGINEDDGRLGMYKEYLRILSRHAPPVFVMENVKGLLSSRVNGDHVFEQIYHNVQNPAEAVYSLRGYRNGKLPEVHYRVFSLVKRPDNFDVSNRPVYRPQEFIIRCEDYGIPQSRHRVILLGIRDDLNSCFPEILNKYNRQIKAEEVLDSLPRVRSGLSRETDSRSVWRDRIKEALKEKWLKEVKSLREIAVYEVLRSTVLDLRLPRKGRGGEFLSHSKISRYMKNWFHDPRLGGVCNHTTRAHMVSDLHRYLYAACYSRVYRESPKLHDFPQSLLPDHRSVSKALKGRNFNDRFRVQLSHQPATTITSHISKDGHYYIHFDPSQCRSLTVREAARLQTFPDNYFFCGDRTPQYVQVGNAVPPFLAKQIAAVVHNVLRRQAA